jgi:hypothetical protein
MVYVIGAHHNIQCRSWLQESKYFQFEEYLKIQVAKYGITMIAEELSEEAMGSCGVKESIGQKVARELGIEHQFCDPTSEERKSLGIPSEAELKQRLGLGRFLKDGELRRLDEEKQKYWYIRERFWLDRIRHTAGQAILFICGDSHVDSFHWLLKSEGLDVEILSKHWGVNRCDA